MVVEILTTLVSEFEGRFADENTTIWAAFPSLLPASNTFLDPDVLKPLLEYTFSIPYFKDLKEDCGTDEDLFQQFKAECQTFRMPLRKEFANHEADTVLNAMVSKSENNHVGKVLWAVMKTAVVTGYSTSTVENSFSARKRVDKAERRRLSPYKQGNLSLLHFESKFLNDVSFEQFAEVWNKDKHRMRI